MNILQESNGDYSIRRVLALIFSILACVAGSTAVFMGLDWKVCAVVFGVPVAAVLVLLFFTTWGDIISMVNAARGRNE